MLIHGGMNRSGVSWTFSVVGAVLDQLEYVVAIDDLAGGDGHVLADLEGVHIRMADQQLALTALHVFEHHLGAAHEIGAVFFKGCLQHFGVEREEVGRVHRFDIVAGGEGDLFAVGGVEIAIGIINKAVGPVGGEQIGAFDILEDRILRPSGMRKAAAAIGQIGDRLLFFGAEHFGGGRLPERHLAGPVFGGAFGEAFGVAHERAGEIGKGWHHPQRVGRQRGFIGAVGGQIQAPNLLRCVDQLRHVGRKCAYIRWPRRSRMCLIAHDWPLWVAGLPKPIYPERATNQMASGIAS